MAIISGVYANGVGEPVVGVQLVLTARGTSSRVVMTTVVEQETGAAGEYKFDMKPGVYVVTASAAYLGVINVNPDSVDGTLNDYLTNFSADELTPAALAEIQELVATAQAAASVASAAATEARQNAAAAAAAAQISTAAAGSARFENFDEIINVNTTAMLELEKPEVLDPDIAITITETINYNYIGPVNGFCDVTSPLEYKIQMYAYTTGEYFNGETNLTADGKFSFKRSWAGAKQFRLVRVADSKWITTLEYPLCIRSYWMPADADPEVVSVMKDRCYTYDQACAALALMAQNHEAVERYVTGLCALVGENGGIKFFVNRLSAQSSRKYYRTGNAAWVLYALAFYLSKYPTGSNAELARAKLNAGLTWLDGLKVDASGDPRHGLYMGGNGKYLEDGSFDPNYVATWCALEHNVDIYFLFELVGRLTDFTGYELRATTLAANIVEKFWIESEGRFRQGVHIDGPDNAAALDQSSWGGIFAVKAAPELAEKCRRYMERFRFGTLESTGYTPYHPDYGYSGHSRGVWTEGTAGVALFERALGNEQRATDLIAGLKPLRNEYGYRDSCDDKKYDTLPDWPSTTNTAWVILTCKPAGFWCVDFPVLDVGIVRY
ncbi:prophage tail fiber N-terminal domain-containing protein [Escherichia coli]